MTQQVKALTMQTWWFLVWFLEPVVEGENQLLKVTLWLPQVYIACTLKHTHTHNSERERERKEKEKILKIKKTLFKKIVKIQFNYCDSIKGSIKQFWCLWSHVYVCVQVCTVSCIYRDPPASASLEWWDYTTPIFDTFFFFFFNVFGHSLPVSLKQGPSLNLEFIFFRLKWKPKIQVILFFVCTARAIDIQGTPSLIRLGGVSSGSQDFKQALFNCWASSLTPLLIFYMFICVECVHVYRYTCT